MASRRVAVVLLPALLIVGALLTVLPASAGSIRVAGVSLTWWYAIVLAPAVAPADVHRVGRPPRHRARRGRRRDQRHPMAGLESARLAAARCVHRAQSLGGAGAHARGADERDAARGSTDYRHDGGDRARRGRRRRRARRTRAASGPGRLAGAAVG